MRYHLQAEGSDAETVLFGPERGCAELEQRLLRFDGASGDRAPSAADEVVYVLRGSGTATVDGERAELRPGTALYVAAGVGWSVEEADGLELLSVLVPDPKPAAARHEIVGLDDAVTGDATGGRMFRLLAPCASATQFIGYIPAGRAPDHYHLYDEVVYVLQGEGALHIEGESAALRPGSCIHLPAKLVHSLENDGPGEMHVLGVFRPAGSPAEAYYVDGTLAYQY